VAPPSAPSGQQFEIRYDDQVAVVTEVGATLRHYSAAGRHLLDGFEADQVCSAGRGQHLVPWPNRIRDGRYRHAGKDRQLALTEPANGNAIHGLTRWVNWQPATVERSRVTMALDLHPQPGWPGTLAVTVDVALTDAGLTVTTTATNTGSTSVPYGTGAHPYLTLGSAVVDGMQVAVPGGRYAVPDDRGIPVDPRPVDGTPYDFRAGRTVGDLVLDTAFTDIAADDDGIWRVRLTENGSAVTLWGDVSSYPWLQLFTGDTLAAGDARRGLAVEPMTCGPDAFNTGEGLVVLEPGDTHTARWGISPR
jgi:aldose 1-epimerase